MTAHSNLAHAPQSAEPEAPPSDAHLLSATARGDDKAYAQVVKRHYSAGRLLAMLLESDGTAARNLLRQATTGAKAALRRGEGPTVAFRPYFLTAIHQLHVVQHTSADTVRIDARDPGRPVVLGAPEPWQGLPVVQAYQFLPETMQMVLWHQAVENLPPHDIAELLGMTTGRVKLYLAAANAELIRLSVAQFDLPTNEACQHTIPLLPRFIADTVSALEYRDVVTHIEFCDSCWSTVRALESIGTGLRARLGAWVLGAHADQYLEALAASGTVVNPATASLDAVVAKDLPTGPPTSSDLNGPGPTITLATADTTLGGTRSGAQRVAPQATAPADECTPSAHRVDADEESMAQTPLPELNRPTRGRSGPDTANKVYDVADLMSPQGAEGTDFAVLADATPADSPNTPVHVTDRETDAAPDTEPIVAAEPLEAISDATALVVPETEDATEWPAPTPLPEATTPLIPEAVEDEPQVDLVAMMNQVAAIAAALPHNTPAPTPGTDIAGAPPAPAQHQAVPLPPPAAVAPDTSTATPAVPSPSAPESLPSTVSTRMIDLPDTAVPPSEVTAEELDSAPDTADFGQVAAPVDPESAPTVPQPQGNWLQVAAQNSPRLPALSSIVAKADPTVPSARTAQPATRPTPVVDRRPSATAPVSRRPRLTDLSTTTTDSAWQHGDLKKATPQNLAPTSWWAGVRTKISAGELSPTIILVIGLVLTLVLGSSFLVLLKQALSGM